MDRERIYSKCGFYCDLCPAFKANSSTEAGRQHGSVVWEKYFGLHFKPAIVRCEGCQSQEPWKTGNLLPDRRCPIRACAVYNGVATCAHCSLFPCEEYSKRAPGAGLRRQREEASNIKISDSEYLEYIEPFEGQTHLKELHSHLRAQDMSPSKPITAGGDIAAFPKKTGLTPGKQELMRQLHTLLGRIFSAPAATYAGQILLERKKLYLWGIIWVMGRYGELRGDQLVLESGKFQDKKECSRLVRKTDNTLHAAVQEAVNFLSTYGIHIEFKSSRKSWVLILGLDKPDGGSAILESLKIYISRLVEKYGEPIYAGSYDLKGKGFKLFTRLEMNDL